MLKVPVDHWGAKKKSSHICLHYTAKFKVKIICYSFPGFKKVADMSPEQTVKLQRYQDVLNSGLTLRNYADRFLLLLACEEFQMRIDIRSFDLTVSSIYNYVLC